MDLPGVAAVDVDLELGEGDELNNSFFDMRGEGLDRDDQKVSTGGAYGPRTSLIGTGSGKEGSGSGSSSSSSGGGSGISGQTI